jgi:hypothetical protein
MLRALSFLAMATAGFAITYSVVPVRAPTGFAAVVMSGINNSGQVAGFQNINQPQPFIGSPSGGATIPFPAGLTNGNAWAVNASGQVVCSAIGPGAQSFIGTPAGSTAIPLPPGWTFLDAHGINDSGQVAGSVVGGASGSRAFIGTIAGSTVIPLPAGWSGSNAYAVNGPGQVAGIVVAGSLMQAFIGTISGSFVIPLPSGWSSAGGYAVNASGQVAGSGINGSGHHQAFIGTTSASTAIPLPAGATDGSTGAFGFLNDFGAVIGGSSNGSWIWDATNGTQRLNSLLPSGWDVKDPQGISNNGLILAQASYQGGTTQWVELIPAGLPGTPAPSTLALVLIGMIGCWIGSRYWRAASQS